MFDKYPNTDFSQMNLDWLLARIHDLEEAQKKAVPTHLPNPYPLVFTGAAAGSYDGSHAVAINIPQGGATDAGSVTYIETATYSSRTVGKELQSLNSNKVSVAQGSAHAGEFLVVGSDGNVKTLALETWQGGSY